MDYKNGQVYRDTINGIDVEFVIYDFNPKVIDKYNKLLVDEARNVEEKYDGNFGQTV